MGEPSAIVSTASAPSSSRQSSAAEGGEATDAPTTAPTGTGHAASAGVVVGAEGAPEAGVVVGAEGAPEAGVVVGAEGAPEAGVVVGAEGAPEEAMLEHTAIEIEGEIELLSEQLGQVLAQARGAPLRLLTAHGGKYKEGQ
ncbi:hypothetical protein Ctob_002121 [Chrysochromulina tobinii]|uniref:Uncharacterized protein n=1 Tax=Chrysochromulina tobinii TaxID=1460289 RepID=A0A0M0JC59_9EUKA|nr:hypothetical protein Ctob_002121 [Chrysochromulina tobinii]|eukprot:KOO24164.1 hypothetical protein Ctob_002121 [Chrysochromulina sp. CCMP291]